MITALVAGLLVAAPAAPADPLTNRLGAVWAGGLVDLMTEPNRDVTASFGALVSAPIGSPRKSRALTDIPAPWPFFLRFTLLSRAVPPEARALHPKLGPDAPALVAICSKPDGGKSRMEAILLGRSRTWALALLAEGATPETPPVFFFAGVAPIGGSPADRVKANQRSGHTCNQVKRDPAGEVFLDDGQEPVRFEAPPGAPFPSGSDHLLDFASDPDLAVAGLMPVEIYAGQHGDLPRPRAAGVRSLITTAIALELAGRLTLVATHPTPVPGINNAVLFVDGRTDVIVVGFRNGYFTTPEFLSPRAAVPGPWSKWGWSLLDPRMPAEILLDVTPAAARCLDALPPTEPDEHLAITVQRCFDELMVSDGGAPFRVRRERWLDAVRAHEITTALKVEAFCADQAALALVPFFQRPAPGKNRDAGPLLNVVLGWGTKSTPGTLKLPVDLEQKFAVTGFMDLSDADLAALSAVDLSFLGKLPDFERWELTEGGGPLTAGSALNAAEAPLPNYGGLSRAVRLHLRRAAKTGTLVQAARDVRHAARLAFSTESMVGQAVGTSLLVIEGRAWEWARAHALPIKGWTPVDQMTIERARRVARTAPAFFSPMTAEATLSRARACDQVTSCAGITEVVAVSAGLESLMREPWKTRYRAMLGEISAKSERCSFSLARYWAARPLVNVEDARRSRNAEVIAGGMMSRAATSAYLPSFEQWYP